MRNCLYWAFSGIRHQRELKVQRTELPALVKRSPHMIEEEAAKFAALLRSDPDVERKSRAILSAYRKLLADDAGAPLEKSTLEHSQESLEAGA